MTRKLAAPLLVLMTLAACASADDSTQSATTVAVVVTSAPETIPDTASIDTSASADTVSTQADAIAETTPAEPAGAQPAGFSTVTVRITKPDGSTCEVCMWLADSATERGQGLMGVTDLGEPVGMIFQFDQVHSGNFFMFQTVTPLSIAWFDEVGAFVSATDMDPCPSEDSGQCERFPADGPYLSAIEVFQGDLASVGIEPGSNAAIVAGSEAETCSVTV